MAEVPFLSPTVSHGGILLKRPIAILESVVAATILTYQERGYDLPPGVTPLETDADRSSQPSVLEISV